MRSYYILTLTVLMLTMAACSKKKSDGGRAELNPEKTFCAPSQDPNIYVRADLSDGTARFVYARMEKTGEAPILYKLADPLDGPWFQVPDAIEARRKNEDERIYVTFEPPNLPKEHRAEEVQKLKDRKWLGTGISQPKPDASRLVWIEKWSKNPWVESIGATFANCDMFDSGLLKPSAPARSYNEFVLYSEGAWAAEKNPEGHALQQAVTYKLPITSIPVQLSDLTSKSWCNFDWFIGEPLVAATVYSFSATELIHSLTRRDRPYSKNGTRMEFALNGSTSVRTKFSDSKDFKNWPEFFHKRDADGREYLQEKGLHDDVGNFRRLIPCNDEKVFALYPDWRELFAKIRAEQLEILSRPEQGNFGFVLPYLDEKGQPQLKVFPELK